MQLQHQSLPVQGSGAGHRWQGCIGIFLPAPLHLLLSFFRRIWASTGCLHNLYLLFYIIFRFGFALNLLRGAYISKISGLKQDLTLQQQQGKQGNISLRLQWLKVNVLVIQRAAHWLYLQFRTGKTMARERVLKMKYWRKCTTSWICLFCIKSGRIHRQRPI